jgi:hypothetical protein
MNYINSLIVLNDIVNQKEKLLQELNEFTNKLFVSGRRMNDDELGWYISIKSSKQIDINKLQCIYDEIISSHKLIEPIIINIDKQNEIYQILMNKDELITRSINILISMYIPGSKNYNELNKKELNQNDIHINILNQIVEAKMASILRPQDKTKSGQKYSHSYESNSSYQLPSSRNDIHIKTSKPIVGDKIASVLRPQDKTKSQSKYSHSYNSKSSNSILLANFVTNNNKSELLLINAIGDGDCFINAIFDYGLYTGNLLHIYDRLINFELLIENLPKYENSIKKAKSFFGGPPILKKLTSEEYAKILDNKLIKEDDKETMYLKNTYKIPEEQLFTCFHHPFPDDRVSLSKEYEIERKKFIKFMKYIQVLYVFTYGYNIMIKKLTNIFSIAKNTDLLNSFDFDTNFINYIKIKYYNKKGDLKPIDIRAFLDDYMNFYARTEGYYTGGDQILIFKKIFFKKLKLRDSRESIPCFFLNYEFEKNIRLSTKEIKFMKILKESVEVDNDKKFISLIRHGEHYKLLVYREQSIITY